MKMSVKSIKSKVKRQGVYLLLCIGVLLGLASCITEDWKQQTPLINEEETWVDFSINIPGGVDGASSRALSDADENTINTIEIIVFDKDNNYAYTALCDKIERSDASEVKFSVKLKTGAYRLMILANTRTHGLFFADDELKDEHGVGKSREAIIELLQVTTGDKGWVTDATDTKHCIPMWVDYPADQGAVEIKPDLSIAGLGMTRMLSRIDIQFGEGVGEQFTLESVYLYNANPSGYIVPKKENWSDKGKAVYPSLIPESEKIKIKYSFNLDTGNYGIEQEIYAFEAAEGTSEQQNENTCLIVGGQFEGETCYYRIDFTKEKDRGVEYLPLLRNHRYIVLVNEIQGKGYGSVEEAFEAGPSNIEAEVMNWDESDDIRYIVVNGHQFMGFTRRAIHFTEKTEEHELDLITNLKQFEIRGENWIENSETKGWSNGHFKFTKKEVTPTINPEGTKYSFTFTTEKSDEGESQLRFIGGNMETLLAITQESSGNGNPDVPPPTGGSGAGEWILAVDQNGVLNLDGQEREGNYTVLFKWGSLLASSSHAAEDFYFSSDVIVWAPKEYRSTISGEWKEIPYSKGENIVKNATQGRGDPCEYAVKQGYEGGKFRMARYKDETYISEDVSEVNNFKGKSTLLNSTIDYSDCFYRNRKDGRYVGSGQSRYWLNRGDGNTTASYLLNMTSTKVLNTDPYIKGNKQHGYSIRCIPLIIRAKLENESQTIMPSKGGTVKIDVRSSDSWYAKCSIDGVSVNEANYVSPVKWISSLAHKESVTVTIPLNKNTADRKFTLQFVYNGMGIKSEVIDIIQKGSL